MEAHMFALKPNLISTKTKFAVAVTIVVLLSACSQTRKKVDDVERIVPVSEFDTGGSWREEYEPPARKQVANKESFRARVKKSSAKSKKPVATSQR